MLSHFFELPELALDHRASTHTQTLGRIVYLLPDTQYMFLLPSTSMCACVCITHAQAHKVNMYRHAGMFYTCAHKVSRNALAHRTK